MWIKEYIQQFNSSLERFQELYRFIEGNDLILDFSKFSGVEDDNMFRYQISKNGFIDKQHSKTNEWMWQNFQPKIKDGNELMYLLSDELYDLWRCASGATSIYHVMSHYRVLRQCTPQEAVSFFVDKVQELHHHGLWTIDYIPEGIKEQVFASEYDLTKKETFFHWSDVKANTPILAIGEDLGVVKETGIYIHLGLEIKDLSIDEYLIWLAIKYGCRNAETIARYDGKPLDKVMVHLKSLMEKHVIMIWPDEWNFLESTYLSFHPTGLVAGDDRERFAR